MPQTTVGRPASTLNGGELVSNAWTNPNNSQVDDATNATAASTLALTPTQTLNATLFRLLAGEGTPFSGVAIPAAASIVGVRFHYDVITGGGAPHVLTLSSAPGASTDPFAGTSQVVRTIGYGTLSAGSSVAGGNTLGANDLSTDAGALAARATLADGTLTATAKGGVGSAVSNATYEVDYFGVTVEWVIRADRTGGAKAGATAGGAPHPLVTRVGGAKTTNSTAGGSPKPFVTEAGGAKTGAKAGGFPHPFVTRTGGAKASSTAGDAGSTQFATAPGGAKATTSSADAGSTQFVTPAGGGKAVAKSGGAPKVQVSRGASGGKATATAGGSPHPFVTQPGGAKAAASGGDAASTIFITPTGGGKATAKAGAGVVTVVSFDLRDCPRRWHRNGNHHRGTGGRLPNLRSPAHGARHLRCGW